MSAPRAQHRADHEHDGGLLRTATRIAQGVAWVEAALLAASVLLIAVLTITNVICRAVFGFSLAITDELTQVAIIVLCFTGLSYAAGQGRHIRMTALYDLLPPRPRKALMVVITAVTALLLLVLAGYAVAYVVVVYRLGGISPALQVPFWLLYLVAPVGLLLAGIQYALAAVKNLTAPGIHLSFTRPDDDATDGEAAA
jgi:C4-dicarboxylate transporter DctQ subunit